ncbi:MAG: hypothetical protein AB9891_14990 [Anaerolineaceae bacterium]
MTSESSEINFEFSPRRVYENLLRRWWWAAVCVIIGALAGWGISALRQPLYEARTLFSFNIDYTLSGVLTDIQEDQALEAAGDLLRSSEVKAKTFTEAKAAGILLSEADIKESIFIERRNNAWLVIVRRTNHAEAEKIAGLWGENFDAVYQDAYRHALMADGLQRYLNSLESCLRDTAAVEPVQTGCRLADLAAIQSELAKTGDEIQRERLAGKNLFAGMLYEWSGKPELSSAPVNFDRGKFILFGALAGFILSLWLIEVRTFSPKLSEANAGRD